MTKLISLGAGAGLVSALLFAVVATGSPPGLLLCYAAPLPIVIVSLGWTPLLGLLGTAIGGLALTVALNSGAGLAFAIGPALPAWALSYVALMGRTPSAGPAPGGSDAAGIAPPGAGYPAGILLLCIALVGAAVALASSVGLGGGDYGTYRSTLRELGESLLRIDAGAPQTGTLPRVAGVNGSAIVSLLVRIAPAVAAAIFSLALVLNLWAGAKVVAVSGRLPGPWPSVPEARMPLAALAGMASGIVLVFAPGFVSVAGMALLGALSMMFALQGLALLHHVTRGRRGRSALLVCAYILTIFFGGTFLPLMALAGMADTATPLRRRLVRPPTRGTPPSTPRSPT